MSACNTSVSDSSGKRMMKSGGIKTHTAGQEPHGIFSKDWFLNMNH